MLLFVMRKIFILFLNLFSLVNSSVGQRIFFTPKVEELLCSRDCLDLRYPGHQDPFTMAHLEAFEQFFEKKILCLFQLLFNLM